MSNKSKFWIVIEIIACVILVVCIAIFAGGYFKGCEMENDLKDYTKTTSDLSENNTTIMTNPIDFDGLHKKNKDIYSWIKIKNTNIDYPIVQPSNGNNEFYLRKNIYGNYDNLGCIFTEDYNSKDFSDPVTVIYGHNIWTQQKMFYELHKFEDASFFNKNKYINIYTENKAFKYEIYSAFIYDDRHIMKSFDFTKTDVYNDFIQNSLNPVSLEKNIRNGVEVTTNDKIVVLSTCIKGQESNRYLVIGVLVDEQQTK